MRSVEDQFGKRALLVCAYGWGKELRLYGDTLFVDGRYYRLQEITDIRCTSRTVLGVASANLRICLGSKSLTLRGIPSIEDALKVVEFIGPRSKKASTDFHQLITSPVQTPPISALRLQRERHTQKHKNWRIADTGKQFTHIDTMPVVAVPVRLSRGEQAYYSTPATLCGEHIQETARYTYPAQDHGLLIVTDRRIIYIGRKSQLVLDHARLMHVSRLRGAIAFEADHWQKRVIFEVPRSEECASCVASVLRAIEREEESRQQIESAGMPFLGFSQASINRNKEAFASLEAWSRP